jgi:hypothetical protein
MRRAKVEINFGSYKDAPLFSFSSNIVTKMRGNTNFPPPYPSPTPSLTDVSTAIKNYQEALVAARGNSGGKAQTAAKNAARKVLKALLKALGLYVDSIANGNEAIILSSGFKVRKPTPTGPLPSPTNLKILDRQVGKIKLRVKAIKGVKMYQWEYILAPIASTVTGQWTEVKATKASVTIEGLQSSQQYAFRVVALGKNLQVKNYSHMITSYIW